jgi:hypothetical protein
MAKAALLLGGVVLLFVAIFLRLLRGRGHLPKHVARLAPQPAALAQTYQQQVKKDRRTMDRSWDW